MFRHDRHASSANSSWVHLFYATRKKRSGDRWIHSRNNTTPFPLVSTDAINQMHISSAATSDPRDCEKRLGDCRAMAEQAVIENGGWVFLLTYHIPRSVRVCISTVMFLYYLTDSKCYWNSDTVHLFLKMPECCCRKLDRLSERGTTWVKVNLPPHPH